MRHQWKIPYAPAQVVELALKRLAYCEERLASWRRAKKEAEEAIHSKGLEVRTYGVTNGDRHDIVVDPNLAARLGECSKKLNEHQRAKEELDRWIRALDGRTGPILELDHDDLEFFGA